MSKREPGLPYAELFDTILPLLEKKKLVGQATNSELLISTTLHVAVMAMNRFRRFSFNSDQSCSNAEIVFFSLSFFLIKKKEKKTPPCDAGARFIYNTVAAYLP